MAAAPPSPLWRLLAAVALAGLALPLSDGPNPRAAGAAGFVVTTLADSGPGSLRQAILDANANPGFDAITFAVSGTIVLASTLPLPSGGPPPDGLLIDGTGRSVTISGNNAVRVLITPSGFSTELRSLTITRGVSALGGAIFAGALTMTNSAVTDSFATEDGGGILCEGGKVRIINSTISGNIAGRSGGGIACSDLEVRDSTINNNRAISGAGGEGMGGGIHLRAGGRLAVVTSTVSGNSASSDGGGIYLAGGTLSVAHSTITLNTAGADGGGVYQKAYPHMTLANTVLAGNTATGPAPDCKGEVAALGPVLLSDSRECRFIEGAPLLGDPLLGPLADNGGPTRTHALLPGSPALDSGVDCGGTDQRGVPRPFGGGCDLGAYEADLLGGRDLKITTGPVRLAWVGGNAQAGYRVYRVNAMTWVADILPPGPFIAAEATSYADTSAVDGVIYCYFVIPVTAADLGLGASDGLCAEPGDHGGPGTALPGAFTLGLNQTTTATMTWTPPVGGADSYTLVVLPLNGAPPSLLPLPGGATSHAFDTGGVYHCFILVGKRAGSPDGNTDPLCGLPGISTLAGLDGGRTAAAGVAAALQRAQGLREMSPGLR